MDYTNVGEGNAFLAEAGLNLFAVLDCTALPTAIALRHLHR